MEDYKLELIDSKEDVIVSIPLHNETNRIRLTWEVYSRGDTNSYHTKAVTFDELAKVLEDTNGYLSQRTAELLNIEHKKYQELEKKISDLNSKMLILQRDKDALMKSIALVKEGKGGERMKDYGFGYSEFFM